MSVKNFNLVAVYGSLLTGLSNHRCMLRANGTFVSEGVSVDYINMYSMGAFPSIALTITDQETPIKVEIYAVNEAGVRGPLDSLEGYPSFYNRTEVPITLTDDAVVTDDEGNVHVYSAGEEVFAWIYHIEQNRTTPVPEGDWFKFHTGQEKPKRVADVQTVSE